MNSATASDRFLREALPLVASYLFGESVLLCDRLVEGEEDRSNEFEEFGSMLRMRHALACGQRLKPIIEAIEGSPSRKTEIVRAELKGVIRGTLDVPRYLVRRAKTRSWPAMLPVLLAESNASTPENQLLVSSLRQVAAELSRLGIRELSAESSLGTRLLRWTRERLHGDLWAGVVPARSMDRLVRESEHRVRKRQTGNESCYQRLLQWVAQWRIDVSRLDGREVDLLIQAMLAFPEGEFFEDRLFEIWCLQQVIDSFRRCGAVMLAGPRPLFQRGRHAICDMEYAGFRFGIWFQRSLPSEMARWSYLRSDAALRGIPDVTVLGDGGRRLVVDAKRREATGATRPEETYKMLGYLENFRGLFEPLPFRAVLCFLSSQDLFTEVVAERGDKVVLIGAHPEDPGVCAMGGRMDTVVAEWLASATRGGT